MIRPYTGSLLRAGRTFLIRPYTGSLLRAGLVLERLSYQLAQHRAAPGCACKVTHADSCTDKHAAPLGADKHRSCARRPSHAARRARLLRLPVRVGRGRILVRSRRAARRGRGAGTPPWARRGAARAIELCLALMQPPRECAMAVGPLGGIRGHARDERGRARRARRGRRCGALPPGRRLRRRARRTLRLLSLRTRIGPRVRARRRRGARWGGAGLWGLDAPYAL